jgi:16S rRNA (adenine1518-N6/adenine1519-N6)-dimethyltransferase
VTRPLLTARDVRSLLDTYDIAPRKAAGQNFVVDPNTIRKVVRDADVAQGSLVCEIGPGLGSLTLGLREVGARVVAVEIDAGLVRALRAVVGDDDQVRIVHADALETDLPALVGGGPAALVANLPYNVATHIVLGALEAGCFDRLLVMVQREVGQRLAARPGDDRYGAVSVKVAAYAAARTVGRVSRTAFYPVPRVDSVTVRLDPRPWPHDVRRDHVLRLVNAGFSQRRKQLRNTLRAVGHEPDSVAAALGALDVPPDARAEILGLADWVRLAARLPS